MTHCTVDNTWFRWFGLYIASEHGIEKFFDYNSGDSVRNLICKTLVDDFKIEELSENEKTLLSEMISYGLVSKKDNKIIHNFCVFTKEQDEALFGRIFREIYNEMQAEIYEIFTKLEKMCKENLPKHLEYYVNYEVYMAFNDAHVMTTGFAFYDGRLYDPKDKEECGLLTFQITKG
jgi:hypothetical protein